MTVSRCTGPAIGLAIALSLSVTPAAKAQTDTTRRATSEQRIPIRKEGKITRDEAGGEVRLPAAVARVATLEATAEMYRQRLEALEAANARLASNAEAADRTIVGLNDSLRMVRGALTSARAELAVVRAEMNATTLRTAAIADSVRWLNQRFASFRNGSVFGNSGFYVGLGTGANFTTGTLRDLGYSSALHLELPIGWSKRGNLIGIRTEFGYQRLEGRMRGQFTNPDPKIYSGVAMLTLNLPLNVAQTNSFYLMGGGGAYQFHRVGVSSSLAESFPDIQGSSKTETKWGVTAGAGLEFHVLGASSLFVQSAFTNASATGRNLSWVPLLAGVTLR